MSLLNGVLPMKDPADGPAVPGLKTGNDTAYE